MHIPLPQRTARASAGAALALALVLLAACTTVVRDPPRTHTVVREVPAPLV